MASWSYSSMSLFQQCPKKYFHLRVAKDVHEPSSQQMRYGLMVHEAAEHYVRDGTPLPPAFSFIQEALDKLKALKEPGGQILCEHKMALNPELEPCDFNDTGRWWRGIADLLVVNRNVCRTIDYKTGKNQYADLKQLELLALAVFKHFPQVEVVKAGLLFVVHPAFIKATYLKTESEERWKKWREQSAQLDEAYATGVWNPKQNFTCRAWCPIMNCAHNGKNK